MSFIGQKTLQENVFKRLFPRGAKSCHCVGLTLSALWAKSWSFADGIDQDQTAQNVQSDLDLCRSLVKSDIRGTTICGTL